MDNPHATPAVRSLTPCTSPCTVRTSLVPGVLKRTSGVCSLTLPTQLTQTTQTNYKEILGPHTTTYLPTIPICPLPLALGRH